MKRFYPGVAGAKGRSFSVNSDGSPNFCWIWLDLLAERLSAKDAI
jgi:hypothetical protein